jgi:hypothetical protein
LSRTEINLITTDEKFNDMQDEGAGGGIGLHNLKLKPSPKARLDKARRTTNWQQVPVSGKTKPDQFLLTDGDDQEAEAVRFPTSS